jgi:hypothetical protein
MSTGSRTEPESPVRIFDVAQPTGTCHVEVACQQHQLVGSQLEPLIQVTQFLRASGFVKSSSHIVHANLL